MCAPVAPKPRTPKRRAARRTDPRRLRRVPRAARWASTTGATMTAARRGPRPTPRPRRCAAPLERMLRGEHLLLRLPEDAEVLDDNLHARVQVALRLGLGHARVVAERVALGARAGEPRARGEVAASAPGRAPRDDLLAQARTGARGRLELAHRGSRAHAAAGRAAERRAAPRAAVPYTSRSAAAAGGRVLVVTRRTGGLPRRRLSRAESRWTSSSSCTMRAASSARAAARASERPPASSSSPSRPRRHRPP